MNRISIAMCTFNGRAFLREQLESIAAQTRVPDELVICDDGSNDGTPAILQAFQQGAAFPVVIHINSERMGATKNFEKAISLCCGDLIFLSDQDDVWRRDKIATILSAFNDRSMGLVFSNGDVVDSGGASRGYSLWNSFRFKLREQGLISGDKALDVLIKHNVVTGATAAFRAEYKSLINPIPAVGIHDNWIALLIASVAKLHAIDEPLIQYRQHGRNQIGAAERTVGHAVQKARRRGGRTVYAEQSEQAEMAAARLAGWGQSPRTAHALRQLSGRAEFTDFRARLPRNRLVRLLKIVPRLLSGEYNKFAASGLRSAAADFVRPN
jgi:glycosyltransferase involved in cell wall biosynthesis